MALIGNNADTLLHGLSDFWLRYFKDIGDLQALYEGTEILLGQHYLNLLSDVLNIAVTDAPLFRKEYYKLYTISQDQLVETGDEYVYTPGEPVVSLPLLQNKVYAATAELEAGVDYVIRDGNLVFLYDPFQSETTRGFARRLLANGTEELAFWAVDVQVDDARLYTVFGHLFGDKQRSTEAYRMFIRGVMQLYIHGPAIERVESALNVVAGLEVVRDDGELLESYDFDDTAQRVTTNARVYEYPLGIPIRANLKDPTNFGKISLVAFEPLTDAVGVTDYLEDPEWWHNTLVPEELLPEIPSDQDQAARRVVSPVLYPNTIGPEGDFNIGDPGYYIGADEDGVVVEEPMRHRAAFIIMDRFLKMHLFMVRIDPSVALTGIIINDLWNLVREVKPAHTAVYFQPITRFSDTVTLAETLRAVARLALDPEQITVVDNLFRIGDAVWIGDYTAKAGVDLVLGGHNPYIEDTGQGIFEHVIAVTTRPAV